MSRLMLLWRILFVSLVLGLSWAVRGHFGHEYGAAWAGSLGVMAAILVAGRRDWFRRVPVAGALGGIGWGVGGIMSYGIIVGYGRGTDFANVWYGLAMLVIVGGLYGFIGGGFLGLCLESNQECPVRWPSLIAEMVAGGILGYGILIGQFGWLMTPPRSELWAACLGAAVMLGWYLFREGFPRSLRLALFTAAGAGLGFALGNCLQTLGTASGLAFNWWNVMEFTLGACGGVGISIGLYTQSWPAAPESTPSSRGLALILLLGLLPVINLVKSFGISSLADQARRLGVGDPEAVALGQQSFGVGLIVLLLTLAILVATRWSAGKKVAPLVFWSSLIGFLLLGHIRKAVFWIGFSGQVEQAIYWVLLALAVAASLRGRALPLPESGKAGLTSRELWAVVLLVFVVPLLLAAISIQFHSGLPGAHQRF